jgi:hypothetical protein
LINLLGEDFLGFGAERRTGGSELERRINTPERRTIASLLKEKITWKTFVR